MKNVHELKIITERLALRPLCVADLDTTYKYASDKDILYMMFLPKDSIADTRLFLEGVQAEWQKEEPAFFEFAITFGGVHIGAVSAYFSDDRKSAEIGWILDKEYRGRGYVTEAAKALVGYLPQFGVKTIIARCDARNIPSRRVMEKLGMELVDSDGERFYERRNERAKECTYRLSI